MSKKPACRVLLLLVWLSISAPWMCCMVCRLVEWCVRTSCKCARQQQWLARARLTRRQTAALNWYCCCAKCHVFTMKYHVLVSVLGTGHWAMGSERVICIRINVFSRCKTAFTLKGAPEGLPPMLWRQELWLVGIPQGDCRSICCCHMGTVIYLQLQTRLANKQTNKLQTS